MRADLTNFAVAGKTGTARLNAGGGYALGKYYASFIGLFPANDPQYVILVKLDDPAKGYAGLTAAPVTHAVLQAALAARDAALDRGALANSALHRVANTTRADSTPAAAASDSARDSLSSVPVVVALDGPVTGAPKRDALVAVPDVHGMALREAVAALHGAGLRVQLVRGTSGTTVPGAGARVKRGATVRLLSDD